MKYQKVLVFAAILVGMLLRTHNISYNFDGDELFSVQAAGGSFSHLTAVSLQDRTHPPLHLFLLFFWMKAWGNSEASARTLSVLASLFFLLIVYEIARRWMKEWPALLVVALCSVSPFFVYFGQQARPYAFIALFASLTVFLLLKCREEPARRTWEIAYGASCAALMYTQYIGALLLLPQFAVFAFPKSSRRTRILVCGLVGMLSILLWIFVLGRNLLPAQGKLQENIGWIPRPSLFSLVDLYVSLFGWLPMEGSTRVLLLLSLLSLASIALKYRSIDRATLFLLLSLAILQPLVLFLFSVFGPISIWATRQVIGSAIFTICLLPLALGLHRRIVGLALGIVLIGWCALSVPQAFPEHSKPPWRSIASLVDEKCQGCDLVGAEKWISLPLSHYSQTTIHDFPDYGNRVGQARRIVFLCRPARCEMLKSYSPLYDTVEHKRITWSWLTSSDTEVVDAYVFERAQTALSR